MERSWLLAACNRRYDIVQRGVTTAGTGLWTPTGSMTAPRAQHTATLLPDGKVLVAGGENTTTVNSSAELYDPGTGLWTPTGSMSIPRSSHMGTLITGGPLSGTVIVAGGSSEKGGGGINLSAELYDPSTGLWADTGSMTIARYFDDPSPTALPDGSILIVGGMTCCPYHWFNEAELYDPVSQTWTPTSSKTTPANGRAVLLPDGKVLVAGGVKGTQPTAKTLPAPSYSIPYGHMDRYSEHVDRSGYSHTDPAGEWSSLGCRWFKWRLGCLQRPHQRRAIRFERRNLVSYRQHDRRPGLPHGDNAAERTSPRGWG